MHKKILLICIVASMGMLVGCNDNANKIISSTECDTTNKDTLPGNIEKNNLFSEIEQKTVSINMMINDQSYNISDVNKTSAFFKYLSSLDIEMGVNQEKYGGRVIEIVTSDGSKSLILYEKDFVYDGQLYLLKDEEIDITSSVTDMLLK